MLKTPVSGLYVFSIDIILKLHNFVLTFVNTSFLSLLLFIFLDLLHLLETPVQCWMKMMIRGIFLFLKFQKEALRVWPSNMMFALGILNTCWQIKEIYFILNVLKMLSSKILFYQICYFFQQLLEWSYEFSLLIFYCKLNFIICTNFGFLDKANWAWFIVMAKIFLIRSR